MAGLKGWLSAAHPFPLALVLVLTTLVGVASEDGELDGGRLALAVGAMALSQLAIGWSNDYLDRGSDATHQPWKPIPAGQVDARLMPAAIALALTGTLALGVVLGVTPLLLLVAGTACGLAYNFGLKDTAVSALPFVLGLALLPAFVWASLDLYEDDFLWLYAAGAPLALAAHVANGIPDIETDVAAGRRGLAARLGRGPAVGLVAGCLVVALCIAFVSRDANESLSEERSVAAVFLPITVAAVVAFLANSRGADVWGFRLTAVAGVVLATALLAST